MGMSRDYALTLKVNGVTVAKNEYFTDDAMLSDYLKNII